MSKVAAIENYDAVRSYWNNEVEKLNMEQLRLFSRLDQADNLIRLYGSSKEGQKKLVKKIKSSDPSYSYRQARRDMEMAIELFNAVSRKSKEMDRLQAKTEIMKEISFVQKNIKDPFKRAMAYVKLRKELRETLNYHEDIPDLPNFSELGSNTINVSTDPEIVNLKRFNEEERRKLYEKYSVKPNLDNSEDVEDVDHEEVD
jgi:hypothetical protein